MATDGFPFTVYAGNAGRLDHLEKMRREGINNLVTATDWSYPKEGIPWAPDNGAFAAWRKDEPFPAWSFRRALEKIPDDAPPEFVVLPDKVAEGERSLEFSKEWAQEVPDRLTCYLAIQDGMEPTDVLWRDWVIEKVDGIFIGGTRKWKIRNAARWIDHAHERELPVHIGRVGTVRAILWAAKVGADSIDSSSWTRNDRMDILDEARRALADQSQLEVGV